MVRYLPISYILWVCSVFIGGGLHRIYCSKFVSGFIQIAFFWLGIIFWNAVITSPIAVIIWIFWGFWWFIDLFFIDGWVKFENSELEQKVNYKDRLKEVEQLFELYEKGAISKQEYDTRKEILLNKD